MRNWLNGFMFGRNGMDFFNTRLICLALIFWILGLFTGSGFFLILAAATAGYTVFRMLSRDLTRRNRENVAVYRVHTRWKEKISGAWTRFRQLRRYKFFVCPGCGNHLRVPRGKGRIQITCPRCGQRFERKS